MSSHPFKAKVYAFPSPYALLDECQVCGHLKTHQLHQ